MYNQFLPFLEENFWNTLTQSILASKLKNSNVTVIIQFPYFLNSPDLLWNHPDVHWVNIFVPFNYTELFSEIKRG